MPKIYFDYNATSPIHPEVIELVSKVMAHTGNPSSMHSFGREARRHVETGRGQLAELLGIRPNQVIFNSGATEGNNTILNRYRGETIFISSIEHPSMLQTAQEITDKLHFIPCDSHGVIKLDSLRVMLQEHKPALVSIMYVNNESGVLQPIAEAAQTIKDFDADITVHSDITQAIGRLPMDFNALGLDFASLAAHKFGGPHGVGALIMKRGLQVPKLLHGGGQERRQRAGTENVAGIAGMGLAAELCGADIENYQTKMLKFREQIETAITKTSAHIRIFGQQTDRAPNTIMFSMPNLQAETILMNFDLEGVALSSGSACSSGSLQASHVMHAMGDNEVHGAASIRLSMGWATTQEEVDQFIEIWQKVTLRFMDKLNS